MGEEWIVRVEGKEYGPVDISSLREWQAEGRLLRANPIRRNGEETWGTAGEIPDLFPEILFVDPRIRRRTFSEIIAETARIFAKGFPQFFCLALLVGVPSFILKVSLAFVNVSENASPGRGAMIASVIALFALLCVFASWPVFVAGLQFATADLAAGRTVNLRDLVRRALAIWHRLARLCAIVYGSYLFWTVIPVLAILTLISGDPQLLLILLALMILAFQVYMAGRLFVNFMFWQQTSTLGQMEGIEALRESKELARSRATEPRLQRPLYRGALIASFWFLFLLMISAGAELPFLLVRLQGITNLDEARGVMQNWMNASAPDAMTIASYAITTLIHAALRPLLGIAFVILYFDATTGRPDQSS